MDSPNIPINPVHVNNKITLEEFVFELIRLNLELVSVNPHDLVRLDEEKRPVEINAKTLRELFDKIEAIAILLNRNQVYFQ